MEQNKSICLSEYRDNDEQEGNMADPNNYQFYFNNIQLVGEHNFKEDHQRMFTKTKSYCSSSYATQPSLSKSELSKKQISLESPLQKASKVKDYETNEIIMINSNNSYKSNSNNKEEEEDTPRRAFLRNNVIDEKQGSKCCLIF